MDKTLLTDIAFAPQRTRVHARLRLKPGSPYIQRVDELLQQAQAVAKPKAACLLGVIDERAENSLNLNGVWFTGRVLSANLSATHRAFPFLATCGTELDDWSAGFDDPLERYWAEEIKHMALDAAVAHLMEHLEQRYALKEAATMTPGSLPDWPLEQQMPLFSLLGDLPAALGVRLTDSLLMLPNKTLSGLRFASQDDFESCKLCPRQRCPGRRAPFDPALAARLG